VTPRRSREHVNRLAEQLSPTESNCPPANLENNVTLTKLLKRSGMLWTIEGGQMILDLQVIRLGRVWDEVHQRHLASKPMPIAQVNMAKGAQNGKKAA
jgi:hypothetical protein